MTLYGLFRVELVLKLRADYVVGRSDHVAQRSDFAKVVANCAKSLNFSHLDSLRDSVSDASQVVSWMPQSFRIRKGECQAVVAE